MEWVSLAPENALIVSNIQSGFRTTCIFPFNSLATVVKMGPSEYYKRVPIVESEELHEAL